MPEEVAITMGSCAGIEDANARWKRRGQRGVLLEESGARRVERL
jgi:hypothetical protein